MDLDRPELKFVLQALAMPAEVQLRLFPDFVRPAEELALDWDEAYLRLGNVDLTREQRRLAGEIDRKLEDMSRGGCDFSEELWREAGVRDSPHWRRVREVAGSLLRALGWPVEPPPEDPGRRGAAYVRG